MQDESDAHADHGDVDQRRHRRVRRRIPGDDIRVDGECDATDGDDAGGEAVKTIYEIHGIDGGDDEERGDGHGEARRCRHQRAQWQRDDLQAAPCHEYGDQQLPCKFEHPIKIPQVVGHAEQADHDRAGKNHPRLLRLREQHFDERDLRREEHGNRKAHEHAEAAQPRRRNGVHVACAHLSDGADFDGDVANQRCDQIGDPAGDGRDEQVDSHMPNAPPFRVSALRITASRITPSRRIEIPSRP